jgi:hypothetical protein
MLTTYALLALLALIVAVASATGRAPLWVAVVLLALLHLVAGLTLR